MLDQHLRGFMQMATLLVFSDSIAFSGFEIEAVDRVGQQSRDAVISLGMRPESLRKRELTSAEYARACEDAACLAAGEWFSHFVRSNSEVLPASFDVPTGAQTVANVPASVKAGAFADASEQNSFLVMQRASGVVEYMLRASPALQEAVARTMSDTEGWGRLESYRLESFLRLILNDQLAKQIDGTYVPAVSRAEQLLHEGAVVADRAEHHLVEIMQHLKPYTPTVPKVSLELLRRAKGDPAGMINEALEMRRKTKPTRAYLRDRIIQLRRNPTAPDPNPKEKIEFERQARVQLGLERETRIIDVLGVRIDQAALEILQVTGLPPVSLHGGKLVDWFKERLWRRRLLVLTELARTPSYSDTDEAHLRTFVEKCTGRKFSDSVLAKPPNRSLLANPQAHAGHLQ